jgi:hypothetical protein
LLQDPQFKLQRYGGACALGTLAAPAFETPLWQVFMQQVFASHEEMLRRRDGLLIEVAPALALSLQRIEGGIHRMSPPPPRTPLCARSPGARRSRQRGARAAPARPQRRWPRRWPLRLQRWRLRSTRASPAAHHGPCRRRAARCCC